MNLMLEGAEPFAAGHVKHQVFERELRARRVQVHLAARQHHEMVADEICVVWIVCDEYHPDSLVSRGLNDIAQHQARLRYAERCRLRISESRSLLKRSLRALVVLQPRIPRMRRRFLSALAVILG